MSFEPSNLEAFNLAASFPAPTKQILPDWSPTGRPTRQGHAASRAYPDFGQTGRPGSHTGGASRSPEACQSDIPVTVVAPADAYYGGNTTQDNPQLWVYVPFALDDSNPITFSLLDNQGNSVHDAFQTLNQASGVLKLSLPDEVVLEPEQTYQWLFIVHCDDPLGVRGDAMVVEGWVQTVADPLATDSLATEARQDEMLSVEQRITLSEQYADNLVWYDALTLLGDGLLENPDDPQLLQAWSELLSNPSVQLGHLSTVPLVDCCIIQDE